MAGELKFIGLQEVEEVFQKHSNKTDKLDLIAKCVDLFTPHTGPSGPVETAVQILRSFSLKHHIDYCSALADTVNKLKDSSIKVSVNFDIKNMNPSSEGPSVGCWFTRQVGEKLFFFWHPDPKFKYSRLHVVHYGKGKDVYSRIKVQHNLLGGILTNA